MVKRKPYKSTIEKRYSVYKWVQVDCFCAECKVKLEFTGWQNLNHIKENCKYS